jgi:hypothetical protein
VVSTKCKTTELVRHGHETLSAYAVKWVWRVFSIIKNILGDQQSLSLQDYVNGSLLVNFNQRERKAGQ